MGIAYAQPSLNATDDEGDSVTISINHESSQPRINFKANYTMICDIYISKQCTFRLVTTKDQLTASFLEFFLLFILLGLMGFAIYRWY